MMREVHLFRTDIPFPVGHLFEYTWEPLGTTTTWKVIGREGGFIRVVKANAWERWRLRRQIKKNKKNPQP